jgi:serine/threonine-protein kinase RsbW
MHLDLVLPREAATVPLVRHLLKHSLVELGVVRGCIDDVELAISEACANVVEHATGDDEYRIGVDIGPERCEIRVIDAGRGFDHTSMDTAMPAGDTEGGRGLLLMQSLVDRLDFESEPDRGTVLHLVKALTFDRPATRRS